MEYPALSLSANVSILLYFSMPLLWYTYYIRILPPYTPFSYGPIGAIGAKTWRRSGYLGDLAADLFWLPPITNIHSIYEDVYYMVTSIYRARGLCEYHNCIR